MAIRVCVAGVSGWTGSAVTRAVLSSDEFELTGAIARRHAGRDAGEVLGLPANGVIVAANLEQALARPAEGLERGDRGAPRPGVDQGRSHRRRRVGGAP